VDFCVGPVSTQSFFLQISIAARATSYGAVVWENLRIFLKKSTNCSPTAFWPVENERIPRTSVPEQNKRFAFLRQGGQPPK
jgi:hypothetical protein